LPAVHSFPTRRSSDLRFFHYALIYVRCKTDENYPHSLHHHGRLVHIVHKKAEPYKGHPAILDLDKSFYARSFRLLYEAVFLIGRSEEHTSELQSRFDL